MKTHLYGVAVGPVLTRPVRLDDPFWQARRARAIDNVKLIGHGISNRRGSGIGILYELFERQPASAVKSRGDKPILWNITEISAYRLQPFAHSVGCNNQLGIAVIDQPLNLLCRQKTA